jgi:chemotaxis protein methyltransferase CheR
MPAVVDAQALEQFRLILGRRIGLSFAEHKGSELRHALEARLGVLSMEPATYLEHVAISTEELSELAPLLTIAETYFFRNIRQLDACMAVAVPASLAASSEAGVRILSAACASGEEAYSLAILLRERHPAIASASTILAVDLNPKVLERARRAHYTAWAMRETEPAMRDRYFRMHGQEFVLDKAIQAAVRFELRNLADPNPMLLPEASFDIVFCRNALMYFTREQFAAVVARLARTLVPDGYLFLGHAETLRGVSTEFHLRHSHEAFYYQKKPLEPSRARSRSRRPVAPRPPETSVAMGRPIADWFDAIQRATTRVNELMPAPETRMPSETHGRSRPALLAPVATRQATTPREQLFELLRREQFTEALALLRRERADLDPELDEPDSDTLLLEAVVCAHAGQFEAARELCQTLLRTDELNAGAQYVLALCHEGEGNTERAIHHNQLSTYLDPGFAMPRVHLGLLWRRKGDVAAARRELSEARNLLEREDAARLLLFGGGFGRSALLALCNAELTATPGGSR